MATVYILYSQKLDRYYIGSCKELTQRISQHQNKEFINSFTSKVDDWELFYFVEGLNEKCARKIESHIKQMRNRIYYNNLKKYPEIIEKLKEKYR